jgi:hypothetical protein
LEEKQLVVLKYLNFIPFLGINNNTPVGYRFFIVLLNNGKKIDANSHIEIKVDHNNISNSGGISVFHIPKDIEELDKLGIEIKVSKIIIIKNYNHL